jgi:LCP family protein required for cell wall assembly
LGSRLSKKKTKRKWPYWVGSIILLFLLIGGGFIFYIWYELNSTVESMHAPLERDQDPERQKEIDGTFSKNDSINALLLGIDQQESDRGRSDTIILLSINPKTESMIMLSIPRDTYVDMPGRGMDKINHAYAFGGVDLAIETVENTFDIPIHTYGRVNMAGFQQGIDAIGGVTVNNTMEFSQGGSHFPVGEIYLNGDEALDYIRMRKQDPQGDFGRNERQREVITAAMNEAANFSTITKVNEILDILGTNVQTNLDMNKIQTLFTDYLGARKNIETLQLEGSGQTIGGIWYYVVPDEEFNRISSEINNHMEAE